MVVSPVRQPGQLARSPRVLSAGVWFVCLFGMTWGLARGADEPAAVNSESHSAVTTPIGGGSVDFRKIAEWKLRETLIAVRDYADANPQAPDHNAALLWVITTALQYGLEDEAIEPARAVVESPQADPEVEKVARVALFMGLARKGEFEPALGHFESVLGRLRFQQAGAALEYAHALSAKCRLGNDFRSARQVYEAIRGAFPLIPQVAEIANLRLARLDLIGEAPPGLPATNLAGGAVDPAAWRGKVVLIDFWATNCTPCLAEMPNLKELYAQYHERGLEIVGVGFDEHAETARSFAKRAEIPWPMVMNADSTPVVGESWRVSTIPALYVIGRDGKIANVDLYGNDLRREVERLLRAVPEAK